MRRTFTLFEIYTDEDGWMVSFIEIGIGDKLGSLLQLAWVDNVGPTWDVFWFGLWIA